MTDPSVAFDNLVPDTRYLLEVAPANAAARLPAASTVRVTSSGPYPTPQPPLDQVRPGVTYDRWDTGWWTLTSVPSGQAPDSTSTLSYGLETIPMQGENHAARIRAVLQPTESGDYTFFLSADDDARLFFNPDGVNADEAMPIAYVSGWTQQYQWDRYDSQASTAYKLKKGHSYYIEAVAVHGLGLDHLEVGWSRDGGSVEVVPNAVLSPTMAGAGGWRLSAASLPAVPGEPKDLEAVSTSSTMTVSWSTPKDSDKDGPTEFYQVSLVSDSETRVVQVERPEITFDGLTADTKHEVEVVAWNASGGGKPESKAFKTAKLEVPDQVKDLKATPTVSSVELSWAAPKVSTEHLPVGHYEIAITLGGRSHVEIVEATATSAEFGPLNPDTEYDVVITPWNELGAGKRHTTKFKTDKSVDPVPGEVKDLKANATSSTVTLSWTAPKQSDKAGPVDSYEVVVSANGRSQIVSVTGTTATFGGLTADTSYEAEVVALNASGAGKGDTKKFKTDKGTATAESAVAIITASVASTPARRSAASSVDIDALVRWIESVRTQVDGLIRTANQRIL